MADDIVIRCENLGKLYRIGQREPYKALRDTLTDLAAAPFRRLRGAFSGNGHPGDPGPETIWALKDVSFEGKRGEVLGIIGRNGAGKSTLLKVLSRITQPTEGRAEIRGRVASLLEVGTGFHPELTGRENIYLNGSILGMRKLEIERKLDEIVAFAEVEKFLDTPVKRYSSGMYVRLAFAVAAHLEPDILLVDEVLAVGDQEFQKKCLGRMGDIGREGRTVLVVSHNMALVTNLCPRAILLGAGRGVADGAAAEVIQQYLASGRSTAGEVMWLDMVAAPGNEITRLHAVRVFQEGQTCTEDVDISKETVIEITYWNLQEGTMLYPAIWLRDHLGTVVLSSSHHRSISLTEDPWAARPHPVGEFRSVCRIPGNFLNEGRYSVTAIVGRGISDTQVLQDYAVSFQVHDTGPMRKEYYGGWIGTVRPRLAWHTECLDS